MMKVNKLKTGGELAQVAFPRTSRVGQPVEAGCLTKTGYRLKSDRPSSESSVWCAVFRLFPESPIHGGKGSSCAGLNSFTRYCCRGCMSHKIPDNAGRSGAGFWIPTPTNSQE